MQVTGSQRSFACNMCWVNKYWLTFPSPLFLLSYSVPWKRWMGKKFKTKPKQTTTLSHFQCLLTHFPRIIRLCVHHQPEIKFTKFSRQRGFWGESQELPKGPWDECCSLDQAAGSDFTYCWVNTTNTMSECVEVTRENRLHDSEGYAIAFAIYFRTPFRELRSM